MKNQILSLSNIKLYFFIKNQILSL